MRVTGTRTIRETRNVGRKRASPGGAEQFRVETPENRTESPAVAGTAPPAPIDPLLSLQEVPDSTARRARSLLRGHDLLDDLDEIRHGLLAGVLSHNRLRQLQDRLNELRERDNDNLSQLLDEIEVRAAVELAKLEMSQRSA